MASQHSNPTLSEIVRAAYSRDPAALAELFEYTHQHIYYYAYMLTGSPHDAEDLLQEGYIKCILALDTLQNPEAFYSWMWTILKNIHSNQLRSRKMLVLSREQLEAEEKHMLEMILSDDDTPEVHAEKTELSRILSHIIHALPPEQQEVILLHFYDGLTLSEIAKIQNCPLSTVKSRLLYAKRSIREAIQAEEFRSGVSLHSSILLPVLPTVLTKLATYIIMPVPVALTVFSAVAGFFGITCSGDAIQMIGTTTSEIHPIRHKSVILRLRILPCILLGSALLLVLGTLAGSLVHFQPVLSNNNTGLPPTALETISNIQENETSPKNTIPYEATYPRLCQISAEGVQNYTIQTGQTFSMQYYCIPYTTSLQEVEIYSANSSIASVNGKQITGVSPGQTRIYFQNPHNSSLQCSMFLYVKEASTESQPISSVVFQTSNLNNLLPGDVFSLNYICVPNVAEAEELYFTSDNPSVAEYDGCSLYTYSAGTTVIRCRRTSDHTELGNITLEVYPDSASIPRTEPHAVLFYPQTRKLYEGEHLPLIYTCLPGTAETDSWYWEISDPAVLSFDGNTVTALSSGESFIKIYRTSDHVSIGQILYSVSP